MSVNPYRAPAESTQPKRRAIIPATLAVTLSLFFLNIDGYQTHLVGDGQFLGTPPSINWTHGWPCSFLVRSSIYPLSGVTNPNGSITGGTGLYSRWPIDNAPVYTFSHTMLTLDVVFFFVIAAGTACGIRCLPLRWQPVEKVQYASLASLCALAVPAAFFTQLRLVFTLFTILLVLLGVALTFTSCGHLGKTITKSIQRTFVRVFGSQRVA